MKQSVAKSDDSEKATLEGGRGAGTEGRGAVEATDTPSRARALARRTRDQRPAAIVAEMSNIAIDYLENLTGAGCSDLAAITRQGPEASPDGLALPMPFWEPGSRRGAAGWSCRGSSACPAGRPCQTCW